MNFARGLEVYARPGRVDGDLQALDAFGVVRLVLRLEDEKHLVRVERADVFPLRVEADVAVQPGGRVAPEADLDFLVALDGEGVRVARALEEVEPVASVRVDSPARRAHERVAARVEEPVVEEGVDVARRLREAVEVAEGDVRDLDRVFLFHALDAELRANRAVWDVDGVAEGLRLL